MQHLVFFVPTIQVCHYCGGPYKVVIGTHDTHKHLLCARHILLFLLANNSTRVDEGRKCSMKSSRDNNECVFNNEGAHRSGEGGGGPAM